MTKVSTICVLLALSAINTANGQTEPDASQDILVTFKNDGARSVSGGFSAPYSNRKRYTISAEARRDAAAIEKEFSLRQVDHWPIKSLSVYCFVYRIGSDQDRTTIIEQLRSDRRVESVQELMEFETSTSIGLPFNDTYANLQHGIEELDIRNAHRHSLGDDVEIAIVDSDVDTGHEDLAGQIDETSNFLSDQQRPDRHHATAIASVIGASTNNAKGIASIAPNAELRVLAACWANESTAGAICDTFSLAKALDTVADQPPDILNLSLDGPKDPLLTRIIEVIIEQGVVVVAARTFRPAAREDGVRFISGVIAVDRSSSGDRRRAEQTTVSGIRPGIVHAPGDRIMVAIPGDGYELKSGVSLATAHVSGVVALLLARIPGMTASELFTVLDASQSNRISETKSINACAALELAHFGFKCLSSKDSEI